MRERRGYWIALARKRRGLTLDALAAAIGYGEGSGSVVSRWESGDRPVPSDRFGRIAEVLALPDRFLVNPPETDEERLAEAVQIGTETERADWEAGEGTGPEDDGELPAGPDRRPT